MPSATNTTDTPSCPSSFRIAIIGGGIGGLTCALSLAHHLAPTVQIDVYEQAPEYREIGAGIGINVSAARILHKLGLGAAANSISGERDGVHRSMRRWDNGEEIVTVDALYDEGEIRQLSVHRAEFLDVLYKAIEKRGAARMHTDKRAVKVEVSEKLLFCPLSPNKKSRDDLTKDRHPGFRR
jgi:salicylate hydroxylase